MFSVGDIVSWNKKDLGTVIVANSTHFRVHWDGWDSSNACHIYRIADITTDGVISLYKPAHASLVTRLSFDLYRRGGE